MAETDTSRLVYEPKTFTMVRPDGTEISFQVAGFFTSEDGSRQYMAVHDTASPDEDSLALVPFSEGKDGEISFRDFEDDAEYSAAVSRFTELFSDAGDEQAEL